MPEEVKGTMMNGLVKMTIKTFKDPDHKDAGTPKEFVVMFNPNTYTSKYEVEYKAAPAKGKTKDELSYGSIKPRDLTFEFIIDGSGVAADKVTVTDKIGEFLTACVEANSDTHRPFFLQLIWGKLDTKVILKSADITYSLFDTNGFPIRAKINAVFTENITPTLRVKEEKQNSPDLTHYRKVQEHSKLPIMVENEYRSHLYYLSVARANGLNNFRRLTQGTQIVMPPIKSTQV
jgi:hypothetical protein